MGHPMTFGWRLVDRVCRLLERDDRDAVCGDLAESQMSAGRALREVVGFLLRRQAALWLEWRPWAALVTIAIPLGFLLSVTSRWFADGTAFHLSLYSRTGDWAYLAIPGWRRDFLASAATATLMWLALAAWSWTAGFALSRVSRRAWWSVSALFASTVVLGTLASTTTGAQGYPEAHFRPIGLYLTGVMRMLVVVLPALYGIDAARDGRRRPWSTVAIAVATVALTALSERVLEGSMIFGWGVMRPQPGPDGIVGTADDLRPLWWLSFVMTWPAVFVVMNALGRHSRHNIATVTTTTARKNGTMKTG
jgi:hypothetical protein